MWMDNVLWCCLQIFWDSALCLCLSALVLQIGPLYPPLPRDQEYFPMLLWWRSIPPPLHPPLLQPLSPLPIFFLTRDSRVLIVAVRAFICSNSVIVCCAEFTICFICYCIYWSSSLFAVMAYSLAASHACWVVMHAYTSSEIVVALADLWKPILDRLFCGRDFLMEFWAWEKWILNAFQVFCKSVFSFHPRMSLANILELVISIMMTLMS